MQTPGLKAGLVLFFQVSNTKLLIRGVRRESNTKSAYNNFLLSQQKKSATFCLSGKAPNRSFLSGAPR
jgi:hypothetical protein